MPYENTQYFETREKAEVAQTNFLKSYSGVFDATAHIQDNVDLCGEREGEVIKGFALHTKHWGSN